jgi:hypothetical protein
LAPGRLALFANILVHGMVVEEDQDSRDGIQGERQPVDRSPRAVVDETVGCGSCQALIREKEREGSRWTHR